MLRTKACGPGPHTTGGRGLAWSPCRARAGLPAARARASLRRHGAARRAPSTGTPHSAACERRAAPRGRACSTPALPYPTLAPERACSRGPKLPSAAALAASASACRSAAAVGATSAVSSQPSGLRRAPPGDGFSAGWAQVPPGSICAAGPWQAELAAQQHAIHDWGWVSGHTNTIGVDHHAGQSIAPGLGPRQMNSTRYQAGVTRAPVVNRCGGEREHGHVRLRRAVRRAGCKRPVQQRFYHLRAVRARCQRAYILIAPYKITVIPGRQPPPDSRTSVRAAEAAWGACDFA
jgi:hypothetical protein